MGGLVWFVWLAGPHVDYRGTGVIVAMLPAPSDLHATRPVIVIHHDPVPNLMGESMSMPFIAASAELFKGLRVGDRIAFGMQATPDALLVVTIKRLGPRAPSKNLSPLARAGVSLVCSWPCPSGPTSRSSELASSGWPPPSP